jgi:hypothetical protein
MGFFLLLNDEYYSLSADCLCRLMSGAGIDSLDVHSLYDSFLISVGEDNWKLWTAATRKLLDKPDLKLEEFTMCREELKYCWEVCIQCVNYQMRLFNYCMADVSELHRENDRFYRSVSASRIVLFDIDRTTDETCVFSDSKCAEILQRRMEMVS